MSSVRQVLIKVVNSHFSSFVFVHCRSKLLILKSNCEQFALFVSRRSLKKIDMSDSLLICVLSTSSNSLQKIHIFVCFWPFFPVVPLFMPKSESLPSSFAQSLFLKSDGSDSLFFPSESLFHSFAHKNERFARKIGEQIPNPDINPLQIKHI